MARIGVLLALVACAACEKVPIVDINAGFTLADAAWFSQEETLFVFYRVEAEQGLGPESQIEISYRTDDGEIAWTPVSEFTTVHTHVHVDCGSKARCGSTSLKVARAPRQVGVRLRYHREGELMLPASVNVNLIGSGPAYSHRSLIVYGVFNEANTQVQWRARHQFPTLRNEEVQELGLRRTFRISDPRYGELEQPFDVNPYGYASTPACPPAFSPLEWAPIETSERAVFHGDAMPDAASTASRVCARSTVTDARGTFEAVALARKNPEVRAAFPALRNPIRNNTILGFLLKPCTRTISEPHRAMQVQRLLLDGSPEICIDEWRDPGFVDQLAARFRSRIDEARTQGRDMVLSLALHHDDASGQLASRIEAALEQILLFERDKSTPRVSGAFVFDSLGHAVVRASLKHLVLWCPAELEDDLDTLPPAAQRSCPLLPDLPDLNLGPFRFSTLPILPTRAQYLTFVGKYSDGQAGRMRELRFLAPERTPISQNVQVGDFGVATFFNNELLTAAPDDAFSYCQSEDPRVSAVVFRTALSPAPQPLALLPEAHHELPQSSYALGLLWDFPFLLRLEYEVFLAGAASAFSLTVPFGISGSEQAYYGTELWQGGEFPLSNTLLMCTRFCDHPTFDSAGVYNVGTRFRDSYRQQCYRPRYPALGDGGFPLDP
ncbi:hypothetical protein [Hyalangium rubrum]|uniref:Lipoprotein n=1 Tax=Hyalangium rubrum TaxID=3103134 RepID=A0ABU5H0F4_9BACT|nr:hypothetical protein [Hyalangium sp. s54d21]MDY7226582.1 hypothetical protein [Hyalangium sp. s54d21]